MSDFFTAIEVSASGLAAERTRMNVASSNLANASATRGPDGGPYQRLQVVLEAQPVQAPEVGGGALAPGAVRTARVAQVQADKAPPRLVYDPGHPDANPAGYVAYPNVNPVEEMVDMITASRAYEAGITALDSAVSMAEAAMRIGG